jgi:enoyl-CoA hydratase/carnithine racemase
VGLEAALDLLLGGEAIGADQALDLCLVDRRLSAGRSISEQDLTFDGPRRPREWPPQDWADAIGRRRAAIPHEDSAPDLARRRLLDVLTIDLEEGRDAAQEAAMTALAELATGPAARAALEAFATSKGPPKPSE